MQLLGRLDNGLGFYRFSYNGSDKAYVGVMGHEVQSVRPDAVLRGSDGFLRVRYDRLGIQMQSYEDWVAAGSEDPDGLALRRRAAGATPPAAIESCEGRPAGRPSACRRPCMIETA